MKIIKFEKDGCMLCKKMSEILSGIGVPYETVNLDEVNNAQELIDKYEIKVTPTIVKLYEGNFQSLSGLHSLKEIKNFCECTSPDTDNSTFEEFHCENGMCEIR